MKGAAKEAKNALGIAVDMIKGAMTGKWRYRVGHAPPFWKVSTSNGLLHFSNANITNLTVTYYGPWTKGPTEEGIKQFLGNVAGLANVSSGGFDMASVFPSAKPMAGIGDMIESNTIDWKKMGGFPSYAEVSITFKSAFDKIFGEEWLLAMAGSVDHFSTSSISE